ncbi:MAG TPA: RimK/LysX family protein [Syntrophorhabdaceae bacterium]|jgi:hypothetical protein
MQRKIETGARRQRAIRIGFLLMSAAAILFYSISAPAAKDLATIGYIEEVVLLPWGIKLPARVDTGASMTSLDARDIVVKQKKVTFKLPEDFGEQEYDLPIVRYGNVTSSMGIQERPVVELELCVGTTKFKVLVNLNDRSAVKYPLIIGRNLLRREFLVDPGKRHLQPPACPGLRPK